MEDWRSVLEDNEWWWRDIGKRFSLFLRLSNWKSSSFNSIKSTELQVCGGSRKKHRECDHYERKLKQTFLKLFLEIDNKIVEILMLVTTSSKPLNQV